MTFKVVKRNATVQDAFVGEGYFNLSLPIGMLEDLQDLCGNIGPIMILARLKGGAWKVQDVRETIRLGLIGGGMDAQRAHTLVNSYIISGYLADYVGLATVVLQAALLGPEDDPVGEAEAPTKTEATAETA